MENHKGHPLSIFRFCPECGSGDFFINNFKSKKCSACGFVYYFNPSAAVACFLTDGAGSLLVAVRGHEPAKGTYDLPGGFIDSFETGEQAVIRELLEETGLKVSNPLYLFSLPNIYIYSGFEVHTLDIFYQCTAPDLTTAVPADDVSQLIPIPIPQLDPTKFGLHSVRKAITRYKEDYTLRNL